MIISNMRDYLIFSFLRDNLLWWDIFECKCQLTSEFINTIELFGDINIRLTLVIEIHRWLIINRNTNYFL